MPQIKDTNVIKTPSVTVDPRLFMPDDVIDLSQRRSPGIIPDTYDPDDIDIEVTLDETIPSDGALDEPEEANFLATPQTLTILSQTVRIAPDGRSVVDVILECEDVLGADTYEIRVSK